MRILYFEYMSNYGSPKPIKSMLPGEAKVYRKDDDHPYKGDNLQVGDEAWDHNGMYLGKCTKIVDDDPNADLFWYDSRELKAIIVELREKLKCQ